MYNTSVIYHKTPTSSYRHEVCSGHSSQHADILIGPGAKPVVFTKKLMCDACYGGLVYTEMYTKSGVTW